MIRAGFKTANSGCHGQLARPCVGLRAACRQVGIFVAAGVAAGLLVGCATAPTVEFCAPRVMLHVEGRITSVEPIHGEPKIVKVDDRSYRVVGTGEVRINEFHLVQVQSDKVRLHGVDIESRGSMRDVFVERDKVIDGVHPDSIHK
jgi:hypothetical protein